MDNMEQNGRRYESLSAYAKRMGIVYQTAWRYAKDGKIETIRVGGSRYVPLEETAKPTTAALYARVGSSQNKDNLETQLKRLTDYAAAKGYPVSRSVKEVGSGLNDNRQKLASLFNDDSWTVLIVEHKDRLTRFGFRYMEWLAAAQNRRIEVINAAEDNDDLMEDLVSVITSFCARIYGRRRSRRQTEKIIERLSVDDDTH